MPALRHVAVIMNVNMIYDRGIVEGIADYMRQVGGWSVYFEAEPLTKMPHLSAWHGQGVIADLDDEDVARAVRKLGVPVVGVGGGGGGADPEVPYVDTDNEQVGRLAAEHLLERGFRQFAFCGWPSTPTNPWSRQREAAFRRRIQDAGCECSVFRGRYSSARRWEDLQKALTDWLATLPCPVGLMASDDIRARHVLEACRRARLSVPDDVAVIGVDNDALVCEFSRPPLTSVIQDTRRIGYEAARKLDRLMSGNRHDASWQIIPPVGIAARGSTDTTAMDDRLVAAAVQFIRNHVAEGIRVADVLAAVAISRTALDQRFKQSLGRTVHAEIDRVRVNLALDLLRSTDLPLSVVAERAGFSNAPYMSAVFHKQLGQRPGSLRRSGNATG
jgi:LacI family transcriptional regulator